MTGRIVIILILFILLYGICGHFIWKEEQIIKPRYEGSKVFTNMTAHVPAATVKEIIKHSKRPKTLTAIAAVETGKRGHVTSKGSRGEVGIFQIREEFHGSAGKTTAEQVLKADWLLKELVKDFNGSEHKAIKAYNGAGKKAEVYREKVYAEMRRMRRG